MEVKLKAHIIMFPSPTNQTFSLILSVIMVSQVLDPQIIIAILLLEKVNAKAAVICCQTKQNETKNSPNRL